MPDEVGTGVLRIEVDDAKARADVDKFVADTDARMSAGGIKAGKSYSDGFSGNTSSIDKSLKQIGTDLDNVQKKAETAGGKNKSQGLGLLLTTALAIGPALVPLGAVAAAGLGAIVVGAGTAALAVKGISTEIKAGTAEGKEYSAGLATLNSGLKGLEQTAATGLLTPFEKSVSTINAQFPQLNSLVAKFSTIVGTDASLAVDGIIKGFITLEPLFIQLGNDSEKLFASFDKFAGGTGLQKFGDYVQQELPQVEQTLDALGSATVKIVTSLGPLGNTSLIGLQTLANIINSMSPGEINALAQAFVALKLSQTIGSLSGSDGKGAASNLGLIGGTLSKIGGIGPAGFIAIALGLDSIAASATHSTSAITGLSNAANDASKGNWWSTVKDILTVGQVQPASSGSDNKDVKVSNPLGQTTYNKDYTALTGLAANTDKATTSLSQLAAAQLDVNTQFQAGLNPQAGITAYNQELTNTSNSLQSAANNAKALTDDSGKQLVNLGTLQVSQSAWNLALKESNGNQQDALILIEQATTQGPAYTKTIAEAAAQQALLNNDLNAAATATGFTTDQVSQYASILGVTGKQLANGSVTSQMFTQDIQNVKTALGNANPAVTALNNALTTFSKSGDTAADKAALLGQVLVSSQGDALSYAGAMADSYAATQNLITGFNSAEKGAINLKTGVIDFTKAGAGPLINSLDQIQSSADTAAQATYQHEVATKGDKAALQDAQNVFENMTNGTLVANAKQLGLTKTQAQDLANQYFAIPPNITTQVQSIGLNDINSTLSAIGTQLSYLTGHPFQISATVAISTIVNAASSSAGNKGIHGTNANGSITEYYANGGTSEKHIAQIAPATQVRIWAEPETGGEAYIPLAPQKRARSTAIWQETGRRLGQSSNFADGGFSGAGYGIGDLIDAINSLASRAVVLEANGTQLARVVNNQQLVLNRGRGG